MSGENNADQSVFDRLLARFEADVVEKIRAETLSGRLHEGGQIRINLRRINELLLEDVEAQVKPNQPFSITVQPNLTTFTLFINSL
jgi:hypothetical protein